MATRVNTRFVFLLATCIVLLVGAIGAFYVLKVSRSAAQLAHEGDEFAARGELRLAMEKYGRAVAKEQTNLELLAKFSDMVQRVPAKDRMEAQNFLAQALQAKRQMTEVAPTDDALLEDHFSHTLRLADEIGGRQFIEELHRLATAKLASYPDNAVARKYRAIATVRRINDQTPREESQQASQDLVAALEANPGDVQAARHLALWMLYEAGRLGRQGGEPAQIEAMRAQALELSQRMVQANPEDVQARLYRVDVLLNPNLHPAGQPTAPDHLAEAAELVGALESQLLARPEPPMLVIRAIELLPRVDSEAVASEASEGRQLPRGVLRAEALARAAVAHEPGSILYHTMLGRILQAQGRSAEAIEHFAKAWQTHPQLPAEPMLRAQELRITSGISNADLLVAQADAATDPGERRTKVTQAESILREIESITGESGYLRLIRGKIALTQREPVAAMQHLDKAAEDLRGAPQEIEAVLLSARARQLAGEPGAAAEQLERVAARIPQAVNVRLQLAEIYNQSRQFARAQPHLNAVLQLDPQNVDAAKLQAQALALQSKPAEAIAAFEKFDPQKQPEIVLPLAALYMTQGQPEKAKALLAPRFEAQPSDVRVLAAMIRVEQDPAARQAMIARSREAGGDEQALKVLELQAQAQAGGEALDQEQLISDFINAQEDPIRRSVTQARLHLAKGELEQAEAVFVQAEQADPKITDNEEVLRMRFEIALQRKDWDRASALAARAESLNADLASGGFFRAQLAAARGNRDEAAALFRRALTARPIYSEGWRQLGDVHLQAGNPTEAADAYRKAIEQRPDNVRALKGLVAVADAQGDRNHALQLLRDALPLAGNDPELYSAYLQYEAQHGDKARALELRRQIAERNPRDTANQRELALLLAANDRGDEAIALLEKQITEHGETLESVATLAQVYGALERVAEGDARLASYVAARGDSATVEDHVTLARYRLLAGDLEGALAAYQPARAMEDPKTRPITREVADMLFGRGLNEQALPLYRELFAGGQDDAIIGLRLAETLLRLGQVEAAQPILDRFAERNEARLLRAMVKRNQSEEAREEGRTAEADQLRTEAISLFEEAMRSDRQNPMPRLQLASVLVQDPATASRARDLLDEALRLNPQLAEARVALADLHLRERRPSDAIREMRIVVDQQPRNPQARARLAELLVQTGDTAGAEVVLREGARLDAQNPIYPQLLGQLALRGGNRRGAIEEARKAFELNKRPEGLMNYASLLVEGDRASEALTVLEDHIELVNAEPVLQGVRAVALAKSDRVEESKQLFMRAVQRANHPQQVATLGRQMAQAFGPSEAAAQLASTPEANGAWTGLVAAELEMADKQYAAAAQRLQTLLASIPPTDPLAMQASASLAMAYYQGQDYEAAAKAYTALLERAPNDVGTLNNLAYLYIENLGRPEEGLPLAETAAKLQPTNEQVLDTLGWAQYKTNRLGEAEQTLRRSIQSRSLAPNHYHLAAVLKAAGSVAQAREQAQRAIELAQATGDEATLAQARALLTELGE